MCAGVAVGRAVAAADLAALETDPQVEPFVSGDEAVFAAFDGIRQVGDLDVVEMGAGAGHGVNASRSEQS
jgi:hypothetical protein